MEEAAEAVMLKLQENDGALNELTTKMEIDEVHFFLFYLENGKENFVRKQ